jgi:hypothetical protein
MKSVMDEVGGTGGDPLVSLAARNTWNRSSGDLAGRDLVG